MLPGRPCAPGELCAGDSVNLDCPLKGTRPCETGRVGRHPPGTWASLPGEGGAWAKSQWVALLEREPSAASVVQKVRPDPCPLSMVTGMLGVQAGVRTVLKPPWAEAVPRGVEVPPGGSSRQRTWVQEVECEDCVNELWEPPG